MYTRSIETIYLSLSAQVAVGTFFMKSPVCTYIAYNEIFVAHNVQINLKWTITHGKNIDIKCVMDLIMPEKKWPKLSLYFINKTLNKRMTFKKRSSSKPLPPYACTMQKYTVPFVSMAFTFYLYVRMFIVQYDYIRCCFYWCWSSLFSPSLTSD